MAPDPLGNPRPARIAVVGCGSVAVLYYTQALRRLEHAGRVRVAAAFDPDPAALSAFSRSFGTVSKMESYGALLRHQLDLVILASPPAMHAQQAIDALGAGIAVHCEKPLGVTVREGELMVEAAARSGRPLSTGLMRRQFAATCRSGNFSLQSSSAASPRWRRSKAGSSTGL
jgi:predicted dehydrogenase